jgi:hypothetical protein
MTHWFGPRKPEYPTPSGLFSAVGLMAESFTVLPAVPNFSVFAPVGNDNPVGGGGGGGLPGAVYTAEMSSVEPSLPVICAE